MEGLICVEEVDSPSNKIETGMPNLSRSRARVPTCLTSSIPTSRHDCGMES